MVNKGDPYKFERFVDRVQSQKIHELKIAEDFSEFIETNVSDEEINLDNTETIVYNYIDSVVTDLDKERIKKSFYSYGRRENIKARVRVVSRTYR